MNRSPRASSRLRSLRARAAVVATATALAVTGLVAVTVNAAPPTTADEKLNPVQHEMRLLEQAMQTSVAAIAAGDVRGLPKLLHGVHIAAGDTSAALRSGAYVPPRGGDQVEAFIALDEAFHTEMIKMVKAAKKNDVPTTATQFGVLMARCHGCHATYRALPPPLPSAKPGAAKAGKAKHDKHMKQKTKKKKKQKPARAP